MKVFFDTNIWLSAALHAGVCAQLLIDCADAHDILTSALVGEEAHAVLARKFPAQADAAAMFDVAWHEATPVPDVAEPADDNDARLVTAAAQAGAQLFVTGDRRVLGWAAHGEMLIVPPREAWIRLFKPDLLEREQLRQAPRPQTGEST